VKLTSPYLKLNFEISQKLPFSEPFLRLNLAGLINCPAMACFALKKSDFYTKIIP